jgi:hypothetical protein
MKHSWPVTMRWQPASLGHGLWAAGIWNWRQRQPNNVQSFTPVMWQHKGGCRSWVWCFMPIIPALERLRQEDWKYQVSLAFIVRPCLTKQNNTKQTGCGIEWMYMWMTWKVEILETVLLEKWWVIICSQHNDLLVAGCTLTANGEHKRHEDLALDLVT